MTTPHPDGHRYEEVMTVFGPFRRAVPADLLALDEWEFARLVEHAMIRRMLALSPIPALDAGELA